MTHTSRMRLRQFSLWKALYLDAADLRHSTHSTFAHVNTRKKICRRISIGEIHRRFDYYPSECQCDGVHQIEDFENDAPRSVIVPFTLHRCQYPQESDCTATWLSPGSRRANVRVVNDAFQQRICQYKGKSDCWEEKNTCTVQTHSTTRK